MGSVPARKMKVTTVLNAEELLAISVPDGKQRVALQVKLPDRILSAEIPAKSLRRAQSAVSEMGADNVVLVLQGNLLAGDAIGEAGITVQLKVPKAAAA